MLQLEHMTIVLDNLPPALSEALAQKASEQGRSIQDVATDAIARGLAETQPKRDLSDIAGTWVDDPEFDKAIEEFEHIDSDLWK